MTDQIHHESVDETTGDRAHDARPGIDRRRMFLAGAGLAGAAVLTRAGTAAAADGDPVVLGAEGSGATPGANESTSTTEIHNSGTSTTGDNNALKATINDAGNNSHAVNAATVGDGAGVGGVNNAASADLGGTARAVEGTVTSPTNGSHAIYGTTNGAGHSVAGDTPAMVPDAPGSTTLVPNTNTTAATSGRHQGAGAGVGGESADGYGGEFVGGKAAARLIPSDGVADGPPADDMHLVGELFVDGVGDLYYNTADGANFTKLNGQGGVVMFGDPQRAFDSREEFPDPPNTNKGRFAAGETREIDLTEFTDLPSTATGAIINLTIDVVNAHGFATVFNGDTDDADRPNASTINWGPDSWTIANGIIVSVGVSGTVKIYALVECEAVVDVVGYVS